MSTVAPRSGASAGRRELDAVAPTLDPAELRRQLAAIEPLAAARPEAIRIARAPGRVNLIGEHTDYNDGFVMPAAIGLEIWICFVPTDDRRVELTRLDDGERLPRRARGLGLLSGRDAAQRQHAQAEGGHERPAPAPSTQARPWSDQQRHQAQRRQPQEGYGQAA